MLLGIVAESIGLFEKEIIVLSTFGKVKGGLPLLQRLSQLIRPDQEMASGLMHFTEDAAHAGRVVTLLAERLNRVDHAGKDLRRRQGRP